MYVSGDINRIAQEALLDAVAGPAFFLDRDNRYLAFNEANKQAVHGLYGVELAIGARIEDVVTVEADREVLLANVARAFRGDTYTDGAWYGNDGANRSYYTITYAPVRGHGAIIGVAAVAVDGTELLQARAALERSQEKFGAAFMASPNAINLNRLSDGMYLEINQGFTSLTGYTSADVEGRSSLELSIWDDPADRAYLVEGLTSTGSVDRLEARFRRKDGSVTVAEMSARIISVEGEPCIMSVTRDVSERKAYEEALEAGHARLERMNRDVVETLGRVVESRDPYTQGHQERAARLCRQIATHMGADEVDIDILETSALVHDIGKLSVPAEILTKAGTLTPLEYAMIREHPRSTYDILKDIAFDAPIAEIALQHHERMDGTGYPDGLAGDAIHPSARILAVADVVEAMATHRPYRPALGLGAAAEELQQNPAKYDQTVVAAFMSLYESGDIRL